MTRTDGRREVSANEPGSPIPLPRWTDRRDTRGGASATYTAGAILSPRNGYYPDPDSDYESRYETASDGMEMDR